MKRLLILTLPLLLASAVVVEEKVRPAPVVVETRPVIVEQGPVEEVYVEHPHHHHHYHDHVEVEVR